MLSLKTEREAVSTSRKVTIHLPREDASKKERACKLYILDKCDRDMKVVADHLYRRDPLNRDKEHRLDILGIVHRGDRDELRIATGIGYGHVINTFASVEAPIETVDAIEQEAFRRGTGSIGKGHLHPFPNGEKFLSGQDRATLETFATMDPSHLAVIINPLTLQYLCYRWNFATHREEPVEPIILRSDPIIIADHATQQPQVIQSAPRLRIKTERKTETLAQDLCKILMISTATGSAALAFLTMQSASNPVVGAVSAGVCSGITTSLVLVLLHETFKRLKNGRETRVLV
jgi:hypothetical protein